MSDDWNPNDPETPRVHYDLRSWSFDQQAEAASELADAEIPHAWDGTDLVVPPSHEARADALFEVLEQRLGIVYRNDGDDAASDDDDDDDDSGNLAIPAGVPTTEYDLDGWPEGDLQLVTRVLSDRGVPFRWEGVVLVIPTERETEVEGLLDRVEQGGDGADGDRLPFETLTTFFLAGERLRRNALDADGLEQLLEALDVADPMQPPYGVDVRLWRRTCELAEELADALADRDDPDEAEASTVAHDLHDLLRPYI